MYRGMKVVHVKYGLGSVSGVADGRIKIDFSEEGEKAFAFPDSFEKFLRFEDGAVQSQVISELKGKKTANMEALRERTIQFRQADLERRKERQEKAEKARRAKKPAIIPRPQTDTQISAM